MTTYLDVLHLHARKPWLTNAEAAEILGCLPEYVRTTCKRRGIKFASTKQAADARRAWADLRSILEHTKDGGVTFTLDEDRCVMIEVSWGVGNGGSMFKAWRPEDAVVGLAKHVKQEK